MHFTPDIMFHEIETKLILAEAQFTLNHIVLVFKLDDLFLFFVCSS